MSYTPTARLVMGVSTFPFQASNKDGMECNLFQLNDGKYEYAGYSQQEPVAQMFCMEKKESVLEFLLLCTDATLKPRVIHTAPYTKEKSVDVAMSKEKLAAAKEWEQLLQELPKQVQIALDESENARMVCWKEKEDERKGYEEQNRQLEAQGMKPLTSKEIEGKLAHHHVNGFSPVEYLIHRICYFVSGKKNSLGESYIGRTPKEGLEEGILDQYEFTLDDGRLLKFVLIPVDEKKPDEGIRTILQLIQARYEEAKNALSSVQDQEQEQQLRESLWVDIHGGFRDMAMVLSSLLSLLRLDDIEAERVFGVQFQPGKQLHKIVEQKQVMEINRFVAGMEEFAAYGSTDILTEYYEQVYGKKVEEETWRVGKWLNAMETVADGSRFSDPTLYEEGIRNLKRVIDSYDEEKKALEQEDPYFSIFVSYIKKEYASLLKGKQPSTVEIIRRCCEKKLYQQALTFLEARMPQYLVKNENNKKNIVAFPLSSNEINQLKKAEKTSSIEADRVFLFHKYREMIQIAGAEEHSQDYYWSVKEIINHLDDLDQLQVVLKNFEEETEEIAALYEKLKETKTVFWKSEPEGIQLVKRLLLLHKALCGCRNFFNHASEMDARPDTRQIVKALKLYLRHMDELEEALTRHQEKDSAFYKSESFQSLSPSEKKKIKEEHEKENWSVVLFP